MSAQPPEDEAGLLAQAQRCPVIRAAYATGDPAVIARAEAVHPPSRCSYAKADPP